MVNNSDQTFFVQLIIWTAANGISMVAVWALLLAIARSPKVRTQPFNLYLAFCLVPDAFKNTSGFAANLANMLMDDGSPHACRVIGFNDAYWWTANLWMSFAVFLQLHKMLLANKRVQRYQPPKLRRVMGESTIIHAFSLFMASLTLIPVDFIPKATAMSSCEAYPEPGNVGQTIFYWAFYMPVTALIPTMLVTGLCIHIWWNKLLPPKSEKSRSLLFYFARLLAVIYIVVIAVILSEFVNDWVQAIAFVVFNLVGLFQVILALFKDDVRKAWVQMWTCASPGEIQDSHAANEGARPTFTVFHPSTSHFRSSLLGSLLISRTRLRDEKDMLDEHHDTEVHNSNSTGGDDDNAPNKIMDVEEGRTSTIRFNDVLEDIDLNENGNEGPAVEQTLTNAHFPRDQGHPEVSSYRILDAEESRASAICFSDVLEDIDLTENGNGGPAVAPALTNATLPAA